jgi:hypothetical protein
VRKHKEALARDIEKREAMAELNALLPVTYEPETDPSILTPDEPEGALEEAA